MKNASLIKRILAYIVDMVIISFLVVFIFMFVPEKTNTNTKKANDLYSEYLEGNISSKEFISEYAPYYEESEKNNIPSNLVLFTITILYFVVFQYKSNGQTFGKKLLNIRVVSNNKKELTINNFIFRSLIINELLYLMIAIVVSFVLKGNSLIVSSTILSLINFTIIIISAIMIGFNKDKRGIQDIIGNTKVIELEK